MAIRTDAPSRTQQCFHCAQTCLDSKTIIKATIVVLAILCIGASVAIGGGWATMLHSTTAHQIIASWAFGVAGLGFGLAVLEWQIFDRMHETPQLQRSESEISLEETVEERQVLTPPREYEVVFDASVPAHHQFMKVTESGLLVVAFGTEVKERLVDERIFDSLLSWNSFPPPPKCTFVCTWGIFNTGAGPRFRFSCTGIKLESNLEENVLTMRITSTPIHAGDFLSFDVNKTITIKDPDGNTIVTLSPPAVLDSL